MIQLQLHVQTGEKLSNYEVVKKHDSRIHSCNILLNINSVSEYGN